MEFYFENKNISILTRNICFRLGIIEKPFLIFAGKGFAPEAFVFQICLFHVFFEISLWKWE